MSATAGVSRTFKVGRYTVDLTIQRPTPGKATMASVEWAPCLPNPLSGSELRQYRAGRDRAFAEIADEMGITVAGVLEI